MTLDDTPDAGAKHNIEVWGVGRYFPIINGIKILFCKYRHNLKKTK